MLNDFVCVVNNSVCWLIPSAHVLGFRMAVRKDCLMEKRKESVDRNGLQLQRGIELFVEKVNRVQNILIVNMSHVQ